MPVNIAQVQAKAAELRTLLEQYQEEVGTATAQHLGAVLLPVARTVENLCDGVSCRGTPRLAPVLPLETNQDITPRQRTIAKMIAEGRTNKEMACALAVSVKTIETHRMNLMDRLGVRDSASVVRWAIRVGLFREPTSAPIAS